MNNDDKFFLILILAVPAGLLIWALACLFTGHTELLPK